MSARSKWRHKRDEADPDLRNKLMYETLWPRPASLPDWTLVACRPRLEHLAAWLASNEREFKNNPARDPLGFLGSDVVMHWVRDNARNAHLLVSYSEARLYIADPSPQVEPLRLERGHVSYHDLDPYPAIENDDAPALLLEQELAALQRLKIDVPILADIVRWQRDGLVKYLHLRGSRSGGFLLWKHVRLQGDTYYGNLGYPYMIGRPFKTDRALEHHGIGGMATAGPFGALRDWSRKSNSPMYQTITHGKSARGGGKSATLDHGLDALRYAMSVSKHDGPHVLAIWCTHIAHHKRDGVFYCLEGVPIADYRATKLNADEWRLDLDAGDDILPYIDL